MASSAETIQIAAADGDLAAVRAFVAAGTAPDAGDAAGHTALHAAASWGHEAVLAWLLAQAGHDGPAAVDCDGDSPLHVCESAPCATLLLEAAARAAPPVDALAALNGAGETAYAVALRERRDAVAAVLRAAYAARGAEPPAVDLSQLGDDDDGDGDDDEEEEDADEAEVLQALAAEQQQQQQ